ncbi:hypothetical protein [Propionimicrobium sp. PCR01-08-3]|uniref:hypothetical protein n=1 Tax=Propionimicrobium sp. PCR01-08-3 TaxID=3052086 RepID=UPI00333F82BD
MIERGRHDTGDIGLHDRTLRPLRPHPGARHLPLHEIQHLGYGVVVGVGDQRLRAGVGDAHSTDTDFGTENV